MFMTIEHYLNFTMSLYSYISPIYFESVLSCTSIQSGLCILPCTFFLSSQDATGAVPLGVAAECGHREVVQRLLVAGAVINYQVKVCSYLV